MTVPVPQFNIVMSKEEAAKLQKKLSKTARTPKFLIIFTVILVLIGLFIYTLRLIEPTSGVKNLATTNITSDSVTLTWITDQPTKGAVVISASDNLPVLPFLAPITFRDDGEKSLYREGFYITHQVTITGLTPARTYNFRIFQGWKKAYQGKFSTAPVLSSLSLPDPVYGLVTEADQKTPIAGALVFLKAKKSTSTSNLLSALTNQEGRWQLDLSNLRTQDLKNSYQVSKNTLEEIVVDIGNGKVTTIKTTPDFDTPAPIVVIKK